MTGLSQVVIPQELVDHYARCLDRGRLNLIATALFLIMISSSARDEESGDGAIATSRGAAGEGR